MNIANWLYRTALSSPSAPALLSGDELHADYASFAQRVRALSQHLHVERGLSKGDRVAIYMKNRVEYLEVMYAVWWLGASIVPVNHKLHAKELAWILNDSQAQLLCTDDGGICADLELDTACADLGIDTDEYRRAVSRDLTISLPAQADDRDLAWVFYTSGTTGRPKGVMLTHGNLIAMSLCYTMDVDEVRPEDAACYAAPMSHGAGLYNFVHVRRGARHVVPRSRGFEAGEILELGKTVGSLSMFAAPTMVKRLVEYAGQSGSDGAGLRTIVYGGGPMYQSDIEQALNVFGPKFVQIYGQGETPMTITSLRREVIADRTHPQWKERLGSVGTAHSCVEVRVVDDAFQDCPVRQAGEVVVRGATVMSGYWRNETGTQDALVQGWLRTGDIGYLTDDGFLVLTDRSKDVIISGGTNIYPREVEEILIAHPRVFEAAVVGAPSPEWGEEVVAFVVLRPGDTCSTQELDSWCKQHMAAFKRPRRYEFRTELPKNNYGKIPKAMLREMLSMVN